MYWLSSVHYYRARNQFNNLVSQGQGLFESKEFLGPVDVLIRMNRPTEFIRFIVAFVLDHGNFKGIKISTPTSFFQSSVFRSFVLHIHVLSISFVFPVTTFSESLELKKKKGT